MTCVSLAILKTMIKIFEPRSLSANKLKSTLSAHINIDAQTEKGEVIQSPPKPFNVETLFHIDIISVPTVLFKVLRNYLLLRNHTFTQHPGKAD